MTVSRNRPGNPFNCFHIEKGQGVILLFMAAMLIFLGGTGYWPVESGTGEQPVSNDVLWIEIVSPGLPPHIKPFQPPLLKSGLLEAMGLPVPDNLEDGEIVRSCRVIVHPGSARIEIRRLSGQAALVLWRRIDINQAGYGDLIPVSGIGPKTARRIIEEREKVGPFASVEDLVRVPGIGPETIDRIRPFIRAGTEDEGLLKPVP